jgi:hypothetical protein
MRGVQLQNMFLLLTIAVVVVLALYLRYRKQQLFHQERLVAMEKGIPVPKGYAPEPWSPRIYLLRGLLWSCAGIAISISLLGIALSTRSPLSDESVLWRAKNLANSAGIPMEEAKLIVEKDRGNHDQGMPVGVALLGLIPIGVGAAYLIFYNTGDKRIVDLPNQMPRA